ncbi:hypothetical protein D8674_028383 [Pyrus ussuriensis x Pyrus communis]|uniref:Uncharacterized protein n=1 Tax=Pyrus ussuriensis x Pyrus communis TaxID=2448454 RepID=A0A5N5HW22_9ROSA|nr:hypothetical protein D8674_028383 [Pyrus ussuriensis x Pyrus communis]
MIFHHHEDHHTHDHVHDPGVSSISIVCEGNLELENLGSLLLISFLFFQANIWLGTLLLERSEDIYHMKGLLSVQRMKERFVFQGNTSFKEKPEIMLSSAILKLSD